jgi:hypothetical protein
MGQKSLIFTGHLKKDGGKLVYSQPDNAKKYEDFVKNIDEGQYVDVFFDAHKDDGSYAQIAKIKVCIRALATETGDTFEDTQFIVKEKSGLCIKKIRNEQLYIELKSFGDCSKEELSLAINTIIEMGKFVNIDFT